MTKITYKKLGLMIWLLTLALTFKAAAVVRYDNDIFIEKEETWQGEIIIKGNVMVTQKGTLTLESGTKITFLKLETPSYLEVRGRLVCQGTKEQPIVFTSNVEKEGSWRGVNFYNESEEARDEFTYHLANVRIQYAQTAISCERSLLNLTNCEITTAAVGVKIAFKAKVSLNDNNFNKVSKVGVLVERGGEAAILNNVFQLGGSGIQGNGSYVLTVKRNSFSQNEKGVYLANTSAATEITSNEFKENLYGVMVEKRGEGQINNNRFTKNKYGVYLDTNSHFQISQNLFTQNSQAISCNRMVFPNIERNDISENEIGIACFLGSYPKIKQNNIYHNQTAIYLRYLSADWNRQSGSLDEPLLHFDAKGNWWGEETTKLLADKGDHFNRPDIFDGYDVPYNQDRGHVFLTQKAEYAPWLPEKVTITYQEQK